MIKPSLPEVLGWQTAGFDKYRIKQKRKFSKQSFLIFIRKKFLKPHAKFKDIIEELCWQTESLQFLMDFALGNIGNRLRMKEAFDLKLAGSKKNDQKDFH